ncbi:hypothetical protein ACFQ08_04345 [Streptosporangium algeriense]|uniref:DNA-binding protein n=1 Tax=Streptosporangium algeriense TaxID=1682748 RepID=A0ABW3DIQ3_9ACTN
MTATDNDRDPFDWLTIPDILTDLDIPEHDWREWESTGQVPSGVVFPDGQVRISRLAYHRWLDQLPDYTDPLTDTGTALSAIRHAIRHAGDRGLSRDEVCELFCDHLDTATVEEALNTLVKTGCCLPTTITAKGRTVTRYRYWGPR